LISKNGDFEVGALKGKVVRFLSGSLRYLGALVNEWVEDKSKIVAIKPNGNFFSNSKWQKWKLVKN
jgi:hypothetical protein